MCIKCEEDGSQMYWEEVASYLNGDTVEHDFALTCDACGWIDWSSKTSDTSVMDEQEGSVNWL